MEVHVGDMAAARVTGGTDQVGKMKSQGDINR